MYISILIYPRQRGVVCFNIELMLIDIQKRELHIDYNIIL